MISFDLLLWSLNCPLQSEHDRVKQNIVRRKSRRRSRFKTHSSRRYKAGGPEEDVADRLPGNQLPAVGTCRIAGAPHLARIRVAKPRAMHRVGIGHVLAAHVLERLGTAATVTRCQVCTFDSKR